MPRRRLRGAATGCCCCLTTGSYNVRKFRHLPRHLAAAERTSQLNDRVLFNYSWLYHRCRATSFDHVLQDFSVAPQSADDAGLVAAALRAARPHIGHHVSYTTPRRTRHMR